MKKLLLAAGLFFASLGAAHAATIDFVAEAAGNEGGTSGFQSDGIDVTLSANGSNSAYLDDLSGGRAAGLGVCSVLNSSNQCNPGSDDNITAGEEVYISFAVLGEEDSGGTLTSASFRDADHYNDRWAVTDTFEYSLDGGLNWVTAALEATYDFGAAAFSAAGIGFRYTNTQYYVSSLSNTVTGTTGTVPLPAGGLLLLTAFGGLAFARRRKNDPAV